MKVPKYILPIIVLAQFCCTSLWFASNSIMQELIDTFELQESALGNLTTMVQMGFILGTLLFAFFNIADRFSPSKVFFISAVLGSVFNWGIVIEGQTLVSLLILRFLTGFFLAGIYPVGMKIAADYYNKTLGRSLGFLVGALVLGTGFPHLVKSFFGTLPWKLVIYTTSSLALLGGVLMISLITDGPHRSASQKLDITIFFKVFRNKNFRSAAFGYFGHMWELYAFWAFIPVLLQMYVERTNVDIDISLWSFIIIGVGSLSCILSGYASNIYGVKKVAKIVLTASGICCVLLPIMYQQSWLVFIVFLLFWGMVVIADSPLFSTMVAHSASAEIKGTALTIVNCIGFLITVVSIQFITRVLTIIPSEYVFILLTLGPLFGIISMKKSVKVNQ
ncbi:MFS transporter [Aquimarina rhabdastrellae]